jgi:sulfite exporter TauE/SafE
MKLFGFGAVWGWLPCGMVYSVLLTAMASGTAAGGAATMLAFGLGTLPMLLALGIAGGRMLGWMRTRRASVIAGAIVLLFGVAGLARAAFGLSLGWIDAFCIGGMPS